MLHVSVRESEYSVAAVRERIKYSIIVFAWEAEDVSTSSASHWIFAEITFYLQRM